MGGAAVGCVRRQKTGNRQGTLAESKGEGKRARAAERKRK